METKKMSKGISLNSIEVTDLFWKNYMELVRKEVIPYQWDALNDKVEGAAPSFAMRNFKIAGTFVKKRREEGEDSVPVYPINVFNLLPKDPNNMEERFYGFLFQDSDFSKWIEAVGYSLTQHKDEELEKIADGAIDIVCDAQMEDGYLDSFYIINDTSKRFTNLRDNHELYCFGHLVEGAIAYYEATGKDKLLKAAERFADCICERFGEEEGKCKGYPGHEIAEMALMRLYDLTKEDKYFKLAKFFIEERGTRPYYFDIEHNIKSDNSNESMDNKDNQNAKPIKERWHYHQSHRPVREQEEAVGHAVRAVYLYSGMADVARSSNDEGLKKACELLWDNITKKKMYITGGIGATHIGEAFSFPYDLPNDTAYTETCAAIGFVFFARRMLEMFPKAEYADALERALYNGVLSGMALDGKSFFYVNPLEVLPEACEKDERKKHVALPRQKWFGCACCPPNIARLLSSVAGYAYSKNEDTIYMHLYLGGKQKQKFHGEEVDIHVESDYPWKEEISIHFSMANATEFTYAVRIPGFIREADEKEQMMIKINDEVIEYVIEDGYAYLTRTWKDGDRITLYIPLLVKVYQANSNVRENIGKVAVMRGPIVYCLEEIDNGRDLHLLELCADSVFEEEYKKEFLGGTVVITSDGYRRKAENEEENLYHVAKKVTYESVKLTFVPYYAWNNRGIGEMQVWIREKF